MQSGRPLKLSGRKFFWGAPLLRATSSGITYCTGDAIRHVLKTKDLSRCYVSSGR